MIKPTALFMATVILGGTALASPAATSSKQLTRSAKAKILVNETGSGDLIAGRGLFRRRSRDSFEAFYLRNCGFRYSVEECYSLYRYGRLGKRRSFSRRRRRVRRVHDRFYDHGRRRHKRGDDDD